jgi:phosphoglycolate phosphatase
MAKRAGAHAAWAKYGTVYDRELWLRLVRVTHWTDDDVRREKELQKEVVDVHPDVELKSFPGILDHYNFVRRTEANYLAHTNKE